MSDINPIRAELRDYAGKEITFRELSQKAQNKLGSGAMDVVMDVLIQGANEIRNEIILSMRNSNTSAKAQGHVGKLYSKGYKNKKGKPVMHRASVPGYPPAPDTGALLRSIIMDARHTEVEVGSIITNPPYPKWLEEGTKRMEARPWLGPAVAHWEPRIKMAVRLAMRDIAEEMSR